MSRSRPRGHISRFFTTFIRHRKHNLSKYLSWNCAPNRKKKWMKNRWAFSSSSFVVKMREDARGSPFVWWQHRTHCRCLTFDSGETGECSGSSSLSAGKCPNLISFKSWIKSNLCVSRSFTAEVFVGMATCWVPICSHGDALQLWFWLRDRRCRSSGAKSGWTRDFRFFLWRSRTLTAG